jgi:hypothetical protein
MDAALAALRARAPAPAGGASGFGTGAATAGLVAAVHLRSDLFSGHGKP